MSGGGGGIIIIRNLIENPGVTADERATLEEIEYRMKYTTKKCDWMDRLVVRRIVSRLLKQP